MYLILNRRVYSAGVLYGLAIHFRIFPIVYAPALFLFLGPHRDEDSLNLKLLLGMSKKTRQRQWSFTLISMLSFLSWSSLMYVIYGDEFLEQCFLYHLKRADSRHNFSVYFYSIYLDDTTNRVYTLLPQIISILGLTLKLYKDLPLCMLTLTMTFVSFNKVITAQYFLWYVFLLPVSLPFINIRFKFEGLACILIWFITEAHWLYWGYQLEFKGRAVFLELWIASLVFFASNVFFISFLIRRADFMCTWSRMNLKEKKKIKKIK